MSTTYRLMPNVSDRIDLAIYTRWAIFIGVIGALGLHYYRGSKAHKQKTQLKSIAFQSEKATEKNKEKVEKELAEEKCQPSLDIEAEQKKPTKASLRNARKKESRKAKKVAEKIGGLSKIDLDIEIKQENEIQSSDIPTRARSETSDSMSQTSVDIDEYLKKGFQAVTKPKKKRGPRAQPVAPASPIIDASPIKTKHKEQKVSDKINMVAVPLNFPQKKKEEPFKKVTAVSEQVVEWDLDAAIIEYPNDLIPMSLVARDIKPKPVVKRIAPTPAPVPVYMVASSKSHNLRDVGPPAKSAWKSIPKPLPIPAHSKTVEEVVTVSEDETTSLSERKEDIEDNLETGTEPPAVPEENKFSTASQEAREIELPVAIEEPALEHVQEQAEAFSMSQNAEHIEDIRTYEASSVSEANPTEQATASSMSPIIEDIEDIEETQPSTKPESTSLDEQSPTPFETSPMSIPREDINNDPFDNAAQAVDISTVTTPEIEGSDRAAPSEEDQRKLLEVVAKVLPAPTTEEELELAVASEDDEKDITVSSCEEKTEEPSAPYTDKKNDGLTDIERKMLARDPNFDWSEEAEELAKNDIAVMGEQAGA